MIPLSGIYLQKLKAVFNKISEHPCYLYSMYIYNHMCTCSGMLFGHEKEGHPIICYKMGRLRGHYAG